MVPPTAPDSILLGTGTPARTQLSKRKNPGQDGPGLLSLMAYDTGVSHFLQIRWDYL